MRGERGIHERRARESNERVGFSRSRRHADAFAPRTPGGDAPARDRIRDDAATAVTEAVFAAKRAVRGEKKRFCLFSRDARIDANPAALGAVPGPRTLDDLSTRARYVKRDTRVRHTSLSLVVDAFFSWSVSRLKSKRKAPREGYRDKNKNTFFSRVPRERRRARRLRGGAAKRARRDHLERLDV